MGNLLKIRIDWFIASGLFLGLWATVNTTVDIYRYGMIQGYYWWFCNLALAGTAYGLFTRSRGWLTGFLSIACFTQVFWIIDNISRTVFGGNLLGIVEFMYQPGLPMTEFLLSHYHYVSIPACLLALCFLPRKPNNSLQLVLIWNPLIFGVSYFAFPASQNINCIYEPCIPGLADYGGAIYSLLFWLAVFLVHILLVIKIDKFFLALDVDLLFKRKAVHAFMGGDGIIWNHHGV